MALTSKNKFNKFSGLFHKKLDAKTTKWLGVIFAVFGAVFAGTINVVGKILVDPQTTEFGALNPVNAALLLGLVTGLFFTPFTKNKTPARKLKKSVLVFIVLLGITDVAAITTNFFGLMETTAVNASILSNFEIVMVVMIAVSIFRERIHRHEIIPISMILVGAVILPLGLDLQGNDFSFDKMVYGDFLILLAAGIWAIDICLAKHVSKKASATRISQLSAFAGVPFALLLIAIFQIPFDINIEHMPSILFIGIFVTGLAYYFFILALRFIGAIRTILLYSTTTVFGVLFAGLILGEEITMFDVSSLAFVGFGIYLLRYKLASIE